MANQKTAAAQPVPCPLCGQPVALGAVDRCASCGMDARDPRASRVVEIDAEWAQLGEEYRRVVARVEELKTERAGWIDALMRTRVAPGGSGAPGGAAPAAASSPAPAAAPAQAAAAPAATAAPAPRLDPVPPPAPRAPRERPRRLTAPNMLGVSGSALLITGAILFVAVTWDTFPPIAQAAVVLVVAAGIAKLAMWLTRHELPVSGGAVGVAAIAFAGVSVLAIDRGVHVFDRLTAAAALAVTVAAGAVMTRQGVRWTGAAGGVAAVGSGLAATIGIAGAPGAPGGAAWTAVGTVAALAALATYRLWVTAPARVVVRYGAVGSIVVWSVPSAWLLATRQPAALPIVAGVAAALVLAAIGYLWRWLGVICASFVFTLIAATAGTALSGSGWGFTLGSGVGIALVAVGARLLPEDWRPPLTWGALPAYGFAAGGAIFGGLFVLARIFGGPDVYTGNAGVAWPGISLLVAAAGLMIAARWLTSGTRAALIEGLGLVSIAAGGLLTSYHFADGSLESTAQGTSRAVMVGALVVGATAWIARYPAVRRMGAVFASLIAALAGVSGAVALAQGDEPVALALAWAIVPVAALWLLGVRMPRTGLIAAVVVAGAVGGATAARYTDSWSAVGAAALAVTAVAMWIALRGSAEQREATAIGAAAGLSLGVVSTPPALITAVGAVIGYGTDRAVTDMQAWAGPLVLATALGIAAFGRWAIPKRPSTEASLADAASRVAGVGFAIAALLGAYAIAGLVGPGADADAVVSLAGVALAGVAAAGGLLWKPGRDRAVTGGAAMVVGLVAGIHGAVALADASTPLAFGLAAVLAPVVVGAALSRWWPAYTLSVTAVLVTAGAAAAAIRADLPVAGVVAIAVSLAAAVAWLTPARPARFATPLLAGLAPAAAAGLAFLAVAAFAAVVRVFAFGYPLADPGNTVWVLAALLALAALAAAGRVHRATARAFARADYFGAAAVAAAMITGTDLLADAWGRDSIPISLPAVIAAAGAVATAFVWWNKPARFVVGIAATAWVTATQIAAYVPLYRGEHDLLLGAGVAAGIVAVLAVAAIRFTRTALGPAVLLATWGVFAAAGDGLEASQGVAVMAAAVAVLAWVLPRIAPGRAFIGFAGLVPAALAVAAAAVTQLVPSLGEALGLYVEPYEPAQLWRVLLAGAGLAAALAWAPARRHAGWIMLPFIAIAAANVPREYAWVSLVALSLALTISGRRINVLPEQALVVLLGSIVWTTAVLDLAVAAGAATALALWVGAHESGARRHGAYALAPGFAAASAAGVAASSDASQGVLAGAALITGLATAFVIAATPLKPHPASTRVAVTVVGAVLPALAGGWLAAGVLLLVTGVALLATAVQGWRLGRFLSAAALSLGAALVCIAEGTNVVEAYTVVPAISALALGLWWLVENKEVGSFAATAPGLALGTVPSIVALAVNPDHLARTLAMLALALVLALWGVLARWFAPLLATAVVAAGVSVTQVLAGSDLVPRWVSIAIVGALLLAISATFEKLKQLR